ncbi:MAG: hypothetical protein VX246_14220 [Myxococcota bacterium]|nr:hypothetical protein [Myxococcota bacterium]
MNRVLSFAPRPLAVAVFSIASFLLAPLALAEDGEVDLVGTWHVLVHYTDSSSANPEIERWDDRLWVFEKKGSRLKWTEYPIVVFNDREGRFERTVAGQTRVLHAWEPNQMQGKQIQEGLEFNTRGSRSKSMRRSKKDGRWQSSSAPPVQSATTIGYHEMWTVYDPTRLPKFVRDDILGSQRAETMSGRTRYDAEKVTAGGNKIRGTYARDETLRGRFRMVRAGEAASVGTKRPASERVKNAMRSDIDAQAEKDRMKSGDGSSNSGSE